MTRVRGEGIGIVCGGHEKESWIAASTHGAVAVVGDDLHLSAEAGDDLDVGVRVCERGRGGVRRLGMRD